MTTRADANVNGYRIVGYFPQWKSNRGHTVKRLAEAGVFDHVTHVNYAFGNIHPETLECFIAEHPGGPPDSEITGDYQGYADVDYRRLVPAAESLDGNDDQPGQALAGNFGQLRLLKRQRPDLKVLISLGGWTWSKHFSRAAATPESRRRLVASALDLYLRGNLPPSGDGRGATGGPGSGAGVFDGIDIDWEWPGAEPWAQHPGNHVDPAHDKEHLTALLAEFRRALDELGAETGRHYLLSAFLPADPRWVESGWDVPAIFESLDFGNVQGYDFYGSWDDNVAGHHVNLHPDPAAPRDLAPFSLSAAVDTYLAAGVDPAQLGVGLATYGHGWAGVTAGDSHGAWQSARGGIRPSSPESDDTAYAAILGTGPRYHNVEVGVSWVFNEETGVFWSIDDPPSVRAKAAYIADRHLGGGMWWDLTGDSGDELTGTLDRELRSGRRGPVSDG